MSKEYILESGNGKFYVRCVETGTRDYVFDHDTEAQAKAQIASFKDSDDLHSYPVVPSKIDGPELVSVRAEATKSKKHDIKYIGTFSDGTERLIRTSPREYASVAQIAARTYTQRDRVAEYAEEFLFSGKRAPAISKYLVQFHVTTVGVKI